jgi:hypothetical protein
MLSSLRIVIVSLFALGQVWAAEPKPAAGPLPRAVVFYSKEDPHWPDAEKAIDAVVKAHPDLKLSKVSFDDVQGYWQLLVLERSLGIDPTGDLTLAIGTIALTSKGKRRDVERYFGGVVRSLRFPDKGRGRLQVDPAAFARKAFGKQAVVEGVVDKRAKDRFFRVTMDGKRVGWVVDAFRHITCPTCIDMQCLIAIELPGLRVLKVRPQRGIERYGVPVDAEDTDLFVIQFEEWTPTTPQVRVDAIVGATKTCRMYEFAVRDVLRRVKARERDGPTR